MKIQLYLHLTICHFRNRVFIWQQTSSWRFAASNIRLPTMTRKHQSIQYAGFVPKLLNRSGNSDDVTDTDRYSKLWNQGLVLHQYLDIDIDGYSAISRYPVSVLKYLYRESKSIIIIIYLQVFYTYRIFYINDITTLVPLSHTVMSEHRPGAKERNRNGL